ncbi:ComF family protein [Alkalimarinus sediminis]|uniref:ComF family protein n=1 Tax=Alkalimarinus sediminis TaxID=1632866 RepID=A0A9E8KQS5_9ALTE|nr:ComF family protein [Alkalimarinus sediminis]UZW75500.1 ComF family protein [Alkalimarinus sediminis]
MARKLSTKFNSLVNRFFPKQRIKDACKQKHCYLCDTTIYQHEPICAGCKLDLPFNQSSCSHCSVPLPELITSKSDKAHSKRACGECIKNSPSYTESFSTFCYTFPINALISDFKYRNKRHLGKLLSAITAETIHTRINSGQLKEPDKLIPVPLHVDKLDARGFNQSADIADDLSRALNIPVDSRCIARVINKPAQASLSKRQRQQNLANAFSIRRKLNGEVVALIDDVVTTGVTAEQLSKQLLEAGAKEVVVWSLARTPLRM